MPVDLGDQRRVTRVVTGGDQAQSRQEHDPRAGVDRPAAGAAVLAREDLVPGGVLHHVLLEPLLVAQDLLFERQPRGRRRRHQGTRAHVHEVVGRRRSGEGDLAGRLAAHEVERLRRVVEAQHHAHRGAVAAAEQAPQARQEPRGRAPPLLGRTRRADEIPEDRAPPGSRGEILLGAAHHRDRRLVAGARVVPPGDQAVLLQEDGARLRRSRGGLRHLLREPVPRTAIRHEDRLLAEDGLDVPARVARVGQRQDGVGVRVIDVRGREEGVQEGLDRGAERLGIDERAPQPGHHRRVVERLRRPQRLEILEPQAREPVGSDRAEIDAAPLDAQDAHRPAAEVGLLLLERGVAGAVQDEGRLAADEARAVDEEVDPAEPAGLLLLPVARRHRPLPGSPVVRSHVVVSLEAPDGSTRFFGVSTRREAGDGASPPRRAR